jgi:hypothetical protein
VHAEGVQIAVTVADLPVQEKANVNTETGITDAGKRVMNRLFMVNYHDILTGTQADGTAPPPDKDLTCGNWTKGSEGTALVDHHDRMGLRDDAASKSWNRSHPSRGSNNATLRSSGGNGLLDCCASN